jgi:hypothetical protein
MGLSLEATIMFRRFWVVWCRYPIVKFCYGAVFRFFFEWREHC